jgi:hypothetical protein
VRVLVLNQRSGLILNGAAESELSPVIEALGLRVVHGWRIMSTYMLGFDCALIDNNCFPVVRKNNSCEFVDLETPMTFPAPSLGVVSDERSCVSEVPEDGRW